MIPKIIHYCWFGNNPLPKLAEKCIESWKKHLPDYELYLWNEKNFDVNSVPYVKEAYELKKYAFVTDYVRLFALLHQGGVYMDTDVEVIKNLDSFLNLPAFSGFETDIYVPTGIMASEKGGEWVKEQIQYYSGRNFLKPDGQPDMTSNVLIISKIMSDNGFVLKNGYQVYKNCMHIFPKDYFCPKSGTGTITLTKNTHCIHHFASSWQPRRVRIKKYIFHKILGSTITDFLVKQKRKIFPKRRNKN